MTLVADGKSMRMVTPESCSEVADGPQRTVAQWAKWRAALAYLATLWTENIPSEGEFQHAFNLTLPMQAGDGLTFSIALGVEQVPSWLSEDWWARGTIAKPLDGFLTLKLKDDVEVTIHESDGMPSSVRVTRDSAGRAWSVQEDVLAGEPRDMAGLHSDCARKPSVTRLVMNSRWLMLASAIGRASRCVPGWTASLDKRLDVAGTFMGIVCEDPEIRAGLLETSKKMQDLIASRQVNSGATTDPEQSNKLRAFAIDELIRTFVSGLLSEAEKAFKIHGTSEELGVGGLLNVVSDFRRVLEWRLRTSVEAMWNEPSPPK